MTQPAGQPGQAQGQQAEDATEQVIDAAVSAAMRTWLAAAAAAVLASAGVPQLVAMPAGQSFINDAVFRIRRDVLQLWRQQFPDLVPWIDSYIQDVPTRLDGLARLAWRRASRALDDARAAFADVDAMREQVAAALDPSGYDGYARRVAATEAVIAVGLARAQIAAASGLDLVKVWVSRRDNRVRADHRDADGQTVAAQGVFVVGGWPMLHPGDPSAPPEQVVNCRCVAVYTPVGDGG